MKMNEFEMINEDLLQDFTHEILNKYSAFCQKGRYYAQFLSPYFLPN